MVKVSTNINLDPELKKAAKLLFDDLGMDMTTAATIFLKQAVRNQAIPFEITRDAPNNTTLEALGEYDEMKRNPDKYKRYSSFKQAIDEESSC